MYHKDPYIDYYVAQAQTGRGNVYAGTPFQKGHGLGSFLAGMFRSALPFLRPAAKFLLPEISRTGKRVLTNILDNKVSPKEALKEGFVDMSRNVLKRMQGGEGAGRGRMRQKNRKRKRAASRRHSVVRRPKRQKRSKFAKKKKVSRKRHYFE
jgi:hypothetical protein